MDDLINRTGERKELRRLAEKPGHHLAILYGRRRIGKTFLLSRIWEKFPVFYYLASETTAEFNRRDFIRELADFCEDWTTVDPADLPSWRFVFRELFRCHEDRPMVVVLDEFQYLLDGDDDIRSQLVAVWDRLQREQPLLVVLSGSAVSTMRELDGPQAALYGRVNWRRHLRPFDYWYAAEMAPYTDLRQLATVYGVFGGTPEYLSAIDGELSLRDNVIAHCLSPRGQVRNLVESMVDQQRGLRRIGLYRAILTAIARGRTTLTEIADLAGIPTGTGLRRKIRKLEELGFVVGRRNFQAPPNAAYRYHLADPALRFNRAVVQSLRNELETTAGDQIWDEHIMARLQSHMGLVFEQIVAQAYRRLHQARSLPSLREWSFWEGLDRDRRPVEMDIVARLTDKTMLTGAIKWNRRPVGASLYQDHIRDLHRLADSGHGWARRALSDEAKLLFVAAGGFDDSFHKVASTADAEVWTWTLEDIYSADATDAPNVSVLN